MTTIELSTILAAPAESVWEAVQGPVAFRHVTRGLLAMPVLRHRTEAWREGEIVTGWIFLLGFLPFSRHTIRIRTIDPDRRWLGSEERGGALRRWNHDITVEPLDDRTCLYRDRIEIEAGWLTPLIAGWARLFYRYRQWRWRRLARSLGPRRRRFLTLRVEELLVEAGRLRVAGSLESAWQALEDAHVLSQPRAAEHVRVHAAMAGLALRTRQWSELAGQGLRLLLAAPGSLAGRYPRGNTGRANVSAFLPMPLRPELQRWLDDA